nr:MAG TPA: Putative ATP dependent Clp protease [Caudoviricetes sp.]
MKKRIEFKALADNTAEVFFYGVIGDWDNSAEQLVNDLKAFERGDITVRIHSWGGDAFDGLAIMNALRAHEGHVTCVVEGICASAASVIAVGGADTLVMRPNSELMIHDAWALVDGNADELTRLAGQLSKLSDEYAAVYARKAGGDPAVWREAMRMESWFTAEEAVMAGLADRVEDGRELEDVQELVGAMAKARHYRSRAEAGRPAILDQLKEGVHVSSLEKIARMLGVDGASDEAVVLEALAEALEERAEVGGDVEAVVEPVAETVEAVEDVEDADVEVEDTELESEGDEASTGEALTVTVDAALYEELKKAAAFGREAQARAEIAEREALVDEAVKDGRISSAARGRWCKALEADPVDAKQRLAAMPSGIIPRAEIGHGLDTEESESTPGKPIVRGFAAINL